MLCLVARIHHKVRRSHNLRVIVRRMVRHESTQSYWPRFSSGHVFFISRLYLRPRPTYQKNDRYS